jgi:hypothetical protein
MESTKKQVRAVFPLLKARVTDRGAYGFTMSFGAEYGSPTTIRVPCDMTLYDIRDGDLLTIYTEVPIAKPS